jgi:hypothetical protein
MAARDRSHGAARPRRGRRPRRRAPGARNRTTVPGHRRLPDHAQNPQPQASRTGHALRPGQTQPPPPDRSRSPELDERRELAARAPHPSARVRLADAEELCPFTGCRDLASLIKVLFGLGRERGYCRFSLETGSMAALCPLDRCTQLLASSRANHSASTPHTRAATELGRPPVPRARPRLVVVVHLASVLSGHGDDRLLRQGQAGAAERKLSQPGVDRASGWFYRRPAAQECRLRSLVFWARNSSSVRSPRW